MDSSRRAVESYWRSRMIDAATLDEDKVTPVYKLEEICDLLRSSHVSIVKEISEFLLKRLEHRSPIVKQKALRLIKYAVGKSGVEFKREMQRHSVAVRQLFHYKGQVDPLKADALNKAVRDTAHEASAAIFSAEENKAAPSENINKRIQGFGNTNFDMQTEDKKSFLSEVVGLGSASIKQGLSSFTQSHSLSKNNEISTYKSPTLRRSLTTEIDYRDKYEADKSHSERYGNLGQSKNGSSGHWGQESRMNTNAESSSNSNYAESKSREEKLLDTIVTCGGVRLQPTRDAIHIFLGEAAKLDADPLSLAIESKLQSPSWQVRMKAVCVLEAILRRKDEQCIVVKTYFSENKDVVMRCSESPQASLREKANKVLGLLDGEKTTSSHLEKSVQSETAKIIEMPNLIDTADLTNDYVTEDEATNHSDHKTGFLVKPATLLVDDLFGDGMASGASIREQNAVDDPFADVSFHASEPEEHADDLFHGLTAEKNGSSEIHTGANKNGAEVFDIFGSMSALQPIQGNHTKNVNDLMSGLLMNENASKVQEMNINLNNPVYKGALNDITGSQTAGKNMKSTFPVGSMLYNVPPLALSPGTMFNQGFPSPTVNYSTMANILAQQQYLATMGNLGHQAGPKDGGYSSPLPDVFNPNIPTLAPSNMTINSKDTKAFDFISDHLAAARDPKRVG